MQFKAFESGIEVNGQTVFSVVDGMGRYKSISGRILSDVGIGSMSGGDYQIEMDGWYSHDAWLKALEQITSEVGESTLNQIGLKIPENAQFPPWVKDIDSAIKSIDIAYHMNHRKGDKVLFDPDTGEIAEGIGHYGYERVEGQKKIISVCNNPYPCSFDIGIVTTMAKKFEPGAFVVHDKSAPCRKDGADSCTYVISW